MAIDAIGSIGRSADDTPRNAGIGQDDFLRILLTQLRFQDPLKPMDNQEFVAQLAQFSSLELNRQQGNKLDTLLGIQAAGQALSLVGRTVEVSTGAASTSGAVTAVAFPDGEARMTVRTSTTTLLDVRLSDVTLVR